MKRSRLARRSPMRRRGLAHRRARVSRYQKRARDFAYLRWVKTLSCWAIGTVAGHRCEGVVEADHAGRRGIGQKCDDRESIPLCTAAHRARHDFAGPFKDWTQARMRQWLADAIAWTQAAARAVQV